MNAKACVIDVLSRRQSTYLDLMKLTGYARCTVEQAVFELRADGHACVRNLTRLRGGRREGSINRPKPSTCSRPAPLTEPDPSIVATSIANRSPLERAWAGEAP